MKQNSLYMDGMFHNYYKFILGNKGVRGKEKQITNQISRMFWVTFISLTGEASILRRAGLRVQRRL